MNGDLAELESEIRACRERNHPAYASDGPVPASMAW